MVAVPYQVVNKAHVRPAAIRAWEAAETIQARQLHRTWGSPLIKFRRHGRYHIYLLPASRAERQGETPLRRQIGVHGLDYQGNPEGFVRVGVKHVPWTAIASHEAGEMLTDPRADSQHREAFDPAMGVRYRINGIVVPDFVYPSWAHRGSKGPWDELRFFTAARQKSGITPTGLVSGQQKPIYLHR